MAGRIWTKQDRGSFASLLYQEVLGQSNQNLSAENCSFGFDNQIIAHGRKTIICNETEDEKGEEAATVIGNQRKAETAMVQWSIGSRVAKR